MARRSRRARAARAAREPQPRARPIGRRRVGARRRAARSRNRVRARATHPVSTGGATPNAPASAVTTSFFSSSTFICSISAAAASAIFALEVRLGAARRAIWLRAGRRSAKVFEGKESTRRKLAHAGGKIPTSCDDVTRRFLREVFEARGGYGVSVIRFLEIPNFGKFRIDPRYKDHRGQPVVSDPGEHGCRRARGLERPAGSRARRARVQPRRRGLDRRGQAALAPAHVQRRCVGAFPEVFNTRIRGTDTSHAARGMACPVGDGATPPARGAERSRDGRDRTSKRRREHPARSRTFLAHL